MTDVMAGPFGGYTLVDLMGALIYVVLMIASIARVLRQSREGSGGPLGLRAVAAGCYVVGALYFVPVIRSFDANNGFGILWSQPLVLLGVCEAAVAHRLLRAGRSAEVLVAHWPGVALCILAIAFDLGAVPLRLILAGIAVVLVVLGVLPLTPWVGRPDQATPAERPSLMVDHDHPR